MASDWVKVIFELDPEDWHKSASESLWARQIAVVGEVGALELGNTPFHARGVSYLDVVRTNYSEGVHRFSSVITHNGHSTYRIAFEEDSDVTRKWWSKLQALGCDREWGLCQGMILFAVDVPPSTDIFAVDRILEDGEKNQVWMFERGHVGHPC